MTATRRHWHSAVLLLRLLRSISRSIHLNTPQQQQQKEGKRTHRSAHTFCKRSNPVQLQTRTIAVAFGLIRFHFSTSSLLHAVQSSCFSFLLKHAHASVCLSVSQSSHPSLDLSPSVVREWVCVRLLEILSVRPSGWLFVWPLPIIHSFHDLMASAVMAKCCLFWYPNAVRWILTALLGTLLWAFSIFL